MLYEVITIYIGKEKINSVSALWQRKKEDLQKEELDELTAGAFAP